MKVFQDFISKLNSTKNMRAISAISGSIKKAVRSKRRGFYFCLNLQGGKLTPPPPPPRAYGTAKHHLSLDLFIFKAVARLTQTEIQNITFL